MRRLGPVAVAVSLLALSACSGSGSASTGPTVTPSTEVAGSPEPTAVPQGPGPTDATPRIRRRPSELAAFGEVRMVVTAPDGSTREFCLLLADTESLQNHGLMNVTELGDYAGMVFRFGKLVTANFYMRDTLIPLTVAFFDDKGRLVSATDMQPCPASTRNCPLYGAGRPFADALEVPLGRLESFGIGSGATVRFGGSCPTL